MHYHPLNEGRGPTPPYENMVLSQLPLIGRRYVLGRGCVPLFGAGPKLMREPGPKTRDPETKTLLLRGGGHGHNGRVKI